MEQNTSIFSRGLSGIPASHCSHERLSREGRGSTALHSPWGQGQSGHWGAASTKAMDVLMSNTLSILLPRHSAMALPEHWAAPACTLFHWTVQHRDREGRCAQSHGPARGQDVAELSCKSTLGNFRGGVPSSAISLCL